MDSLFRTRIVPSRIVLGTAGFGSEISRPASFAVMDAYAAAGGNFIDTAHIYAAWIEDGWGASERTVGEWIRAHGARDAVVLATKGAHPPLDAMHLGRGGKADIERDIEESLDRLGVDSVDVYWLHRDDPDRPVGEMIETLAALMRDGRIGCYAASNWTTERMDAANAYADAHGLPRLAANQCGWALAAHGTDPNAPSPMRYVDGAMHAWHVERAFSLAAYTAQARGFFGAANAAWAANGFQGEAPKAREYDTPSNRARLLRTIEAAAKKNCTPSQIALAYVLNQPFPAFAIVGTGNAAHLGEAMPALEISLSSEECSYLEG